MSDALVVGLGLLIWSCKAMCSLCLPLLVLVCMGMAKVCTKVGLYQHQAWGVSAKVSRCPKCCFAYLLLAC